MEDKLLGMVYGFPHAGRKIRQKNTELSDTGWTLHIKDQSWVEDTENQVEFIIQTLGLTGGERILDMACGFGRHSLSLARRGFSVVGVDYTKAYIDDARMHAKAHNLEVDLVLSDIRKLDYNCEFDVVLNLADGAIGYFETEEENLAVFEKVAKALKPGGKHLMDVCNAEHAEHFFPKRHWQIGTKILALPEFDWDSENRRMIYGGWEIEFGSIAQRPLPIKRGTGARLYSLEELEKILDAHHMKIRSAFSNYYGKEATYKELQLIVYSQKA